MYSDIWDGQDLSLMARHLMDNHTVVDMAYQPSPYPIIWIVRDDGILLSLTYQHAPPSFGQTLTDGLVAWAQGVTGPALSVAVPPVTNSPFDIVESVCVVPEGSEDVVYGSVYRYLGSGAGGGIRSVERMSSPVVPLTPLTATALTTNVFTQDRQIDARYGNFLDCSLSFDGHNSTLLSTLQIDSVLVPGSVSAADYQPGAQIKITICLRLRS